MWSKRISARHLTSSRRVITRSICYLIDDVQFFANKERTQEEFFNAFEALLAKKSHIVMTSDTYPKGLPDIHERLVSRFDSGLTVAIEPPELEMRVAILINKARAEHTEMPEEVAFFVAKNVQIERARTRRRAAQNPRLFALQPERDFDPARARGACAICCRSRTGRSASRTSRKTVADYYKIKVADMYSKKRPASIARPRQIAMYLAKELTQKSLPEIGELFGGRDHTTVLHAVRKIAGERQQLSEVNQQLHVLEQTLERMTRPQPSKRFGSPPAFAPCGRLSASPYRRAAPAARQSRLRGPWWTGMRWVCLVAV